MEYWTDDVNGIVIGEQAHPYHFYTLPNQDPNGVVSFITKRWFEYDSEAIEWFKENYPKEYKLGAEMRVYD